MRAGRFFVLGVVLLLCGAARAQHVKTELLSDVSSMQAGKPFWLGVKLTINPGWHIYWKNPGDSGLPTRVKLNLPDGFTAGPLQYPTPRRFVLPGNIVCFGYENSVMLLAKVTPPAALPADFQGHFEAQVSWLVCSDVCIPGKETASLDLGASAAPHSPNRELFDDWISQLPANASSKDLKSSTIRIRYLPNSNNRNCTIELRWVRPAPDSADFFPSALDDYNFVNTQVSSSQDTTTIGFTLQPLAGKTPGPVTFEATVGYDQDGKRRGINISVALPLAKGNNH
jgi:thiol:disulfide interchange protein DsbD